MTEQDTSGYWERHEDEDGLHAVSFNLCVTVVPDGEGSARLFKRHAMQPIKQRTKTVLVGELNGVRLYVDGQNLVMTTQDIYPEFID